MTEFNELPACYRFASATIIFGSLLKKSRFIPLATWDDALELANQSYDPNDQAQKEFLILVEKAKKNIWKREKKEEIHGIGNLKLTIYKCQINLCLDSILMEKEISTALKSGVI